MVEAYPLSEESMILTITKINAEDVNFDLFVANGTVDEPWAVFEFGELDDVIELAKLVKGPAPDSDSALYKYNERYELYVHDVNGHRRREARTLR